MPDWQQRKEFLLNRATRWCSWNRCLKDWRTAWLMDIVIRKFLNDSDLDKLFEGRNGKELRQLAENNARTAINGLVRKSSEDSNFKRIKVFPQLNVADTADELSKMPEDAIHSFKLKFSPTTCNISEPEEDEALRDFNMK